MKQDNSEMFEALGYKRPTPKEIASLYQTKPELYDCQICRYYQELPRYKSEQTKEQKSNVWRSFLGGVANAL